MTWKTGVGYVATNVSIDRIDPSGPYQEGSVQLVCRVVNMMKNDLGESEFIRWCKEIAKENSDSGDLRSAA